MPKELICGVAVLHFADSEWGEGRALLAFGDRRPGNGLLDALGAAALRNGMPLSVVRVGTVASLLKWIVGAPSPKADLRWVLEVASGLGVACDGEVLWDASFPAGLVWAVRRTAPRLACVVPSGYGNSRSMRRALAFVGRLVEGRLFVAESSWLEVPPGAEEVT